MSNETLVKATVVSVGCKLPNGIHLDLKTNDGAVRHTLKGANDARIIGGFGVTDNIPTDFMTQWLKKNAKHQAVINGLIFIHNDPESVRAMAREREGVVTGLESIDPIKSGMLKGQDGQTDSSALANYNKLKSENPDRNRQRAE